MKKLISFFIVVLLLSAFQINAFASNSSNIYKLDELNLEVTIPSELHVITGDTISLDSQLVEKGMDLKTIQQQNKSNNIYLDAINLVPLYEIVITMIEYDGSKKISNFNDYNEDEFDAVYKVWVDAVKAQGMHYTGYTVYKNDQATYLVIELWQMNGSQKVYSCQYYTVYNGQAINFTLHSFDGVTTSAMRNQQKEIVDSVVYTNSNSIPSQTGSISAITESNARTEATVNVLTNAAYKGLGGVISGLVIAGIVTIIALIARRKNRKSDSHGKELNKIKSFNEANEISDSEIINIDSSESECTKNGNTIGILKDDDTKKESVSEADQTILNSPDQTRKEMVEYFERLGDLHSKGILSDEEYSAAKKRIIEKL